MNSGDATFTLTREPDCLCATLTEAGEVTGIYLGDQRFIGRMVGRFLRSGARYNGHGE